MTPVHRHNPEFRAAARHFGRRRFLTATGAAAALAFAVQLPSAGVAAADELDGRRIPEDPFTLGVASGDPLPDSVLLWTRLAQFDILDTRQYRSNQAYGDGWQVPRPESEDPSRTMTGATQERWLLDGWRDAQALWNVVPQQVVFARRRNVPTPDLKLSMDSWDGYPASRRRILDGAAAAGVANLMVLTGDVHVGYGLDIKADFDDPGSRTVGTELVATSISSGKDGSDRPANHDALTTANPHMRFYNGRRGYLTVELGTEQARADFRTVARVTTPGAPITTAASFVTEAGNPGLRPA
ncbi:alkaline phosphatase D family protein [Streptomyces sp. HUAS MG47]|uniref:alkaline phosphatase D family protein n=1 Tax=Streptomyces solicamelliae TaxID=3231716 RepID=UPI00387791BF